VALREPPRVKEIGYKKSCAAHHRRRKLDARGVDRVSAQQLPQHWDTRTFECLCVTLSINGRESGKLGEGGAVMHVLISNFAELGLPSIRYCLALYMLKTVLSSHTVANPYSFARSPSSRFSSGLRFAK
jgi:hypothetical protein